MLFFSTGKTLYSQFDWLRVHRFVPYIKRGIQITIADVYICLYVFIRFFVNVQIIVFNVWIIRQSFCARTHIRLIAWAGGWWVWPFLGTAMGMVVRWSLFFVAFNKNGFVWFFCDPTGHFSVISIEQTEKGSGSRDGSRLLFSRNLQWMKFFSSIPHSHAADLGCRPFFGHSNRNTGFRRCISLFPNLSRCSFLYILASVFVIPSRRPTSQKNDGECRVTVQKK